MKKIAYCLISDGMGGAENILLQTLTSFKSNDNFYLIINNEIAANFAHVLAPERIINIGDVYLHLKYKYLRYFLNNRYYNLRRQIIDLKLNKVKSFVKRNDIHIIHAHLDYALYLGLKLKKTSLLNLKVIFTVHSAFGFLEDKSMKPQLSFDKIDFKSVDSFVFVSEYVYDIYKRNVTVNHSQIIYNGIQTNNIENIKRVYNNEIPFTILYLGGEKPVKGYDVLIDTIDILVNKQQIKNIKVFVLGKVSLNGDLLKLIEKRGLTTYMEIVGFVNSKDIYQYFDNSHILFMPSRTEAMPLAAIEAVFNNLPIVATAVGGIPELVKNRFNGYCVKLNPEEFSEAILNIVFDYNSFIIKAEEYNNQIKKKYTLKNMCDELIKYYSRFD